MDLWERYVKDDESGLYSPLDDFKLAQHQFLEDPGPKTFPVLRQAYRKRYGEHALSELVGFLEEHVAKIPAPWRHLALAELYDHSYRLAEAEYELEKALELPEGRVWEVYELYISTLLKRKRWEAALDAAICCEKTLKAKLQDSQRAKVYYYRACAAALAGDPEAALGNLTVAEVYGFEKVQLNLLRLKLLVYSNKDVDMQVQIIEDLYNSRLSPQYRKELQQLKNRVWRALLKALIELLKFREVHYAGQEVTTGR
jgi:hypothetical protein